MMRAARSLERAVRPAERSLHARDPVPLAAAATLSILVGITLVHGGRAADFVVAAVTGFALIALIDRLQYTAIFVWVAASGIAYPLIRYPTAHPIVTFNRAWVIAIAVLVTARSRSVTRSRSTHRVLLAGGWLILAFGLRALFTSGQVKTALETWLDACLLPGILFLATRRQITSANRLDRLGGAFAAAGASLGALGIAQRLFGLDLASRIGGASAITSTVGLRVSGPFPTDDMLAVALLICFAATLFWIQCNPPSRMPLGAIVVALELVGIYFTFFRGAFIAVLAIIVLGLGLRPKKYARLFTVGGFVAALAVIAVMHVNPSSGLSQRLNNGQNISGRLATYSEGYAIFTAHPFFGVGVGQFSLAQAGVLPTSVNGVQAVDTAHSSYVDTLGEQGLWGFLPLLALTGAVALLARSLIMSATQREDVVFGASLAAAAVAYLFMSMELTTILVSTDSLFLAVMLGAGSARADALAPPSSQKGLPGR